MGNKTVLDFQVIDHGAEGSSFFQGCATSGLRFDHCVTGLGNTALEALEDALGELALLDFDVSDSFVELCKKDLDPRTCNTSKCRGCEYENREENENCPDSCETWCRVSIRVS